MFNAVSREIFKKCDTMKVKLTKPASMPQFYNALQVVMKDTKKAESVLLDHIENQIHQKKQFVDDLAMQLEQNKKRHFQMLEEKEVIKVAVQLIQSAESEDDKAIRLGIDKKREIVDEKIRKVEEEK